MSAQYSIHNIDEVALLLLNTPPANSTNDTDLHPIGYNYFFFSFIDKIWASIYIYGQESPGWISLYKLVNIIFFVENIKKRQFLWRKLLVNEFQTAMGGVLLGISKKFISIFKT